MECREISATDSHISMRGGPRPCELEAAEVLAGLVGFRRLRRDLEGDPVLSSQDQPTTTTQFCNFVPTATTNMNTEKIDKVDENVPSIFCNKKCQRQKLTEAELEDRKLRRIMANRESARQTIHRRQAIHMELIRKAGDVSEENKDLKKKKELVMEEYNSLKDRNAYLKSLLEKAKIENRGETREEPKTSQQTNPPTAADTNNPFPMHNPPPLLPYFWPSLIPSPDFFPFPHASGSSSTLPHPQQDNRAPGLVVFAVPCLLPFLACSSSTPDSQEGQKSRHTVSSDQNMNAAESGKTTHCAAGIDSGGGVASQIVKNNSRVAARTRLGIEKAEDSFAAMEARRRRKHLMKLKNIDWHRNVRPLYSPPG